jgi:hypothetical protein
MLARVNACAMIGLEGVRVDVEVNLTSSNEFPIMNVRAEIFPFKTKAPTDRSLSRLTSGS